METLIANLSHLNLYSTNKLDWYNNTNYNLACISDFINSRVYTYDDIKEGEFIGMLEGTLLPSKHYIYHKHCFWLSDYEFLDCRDGPRCILAMTREGFYEGFKENCKVALSYTSDRVNAYVYALCDIKAGEELFMEKEPY